MSQFENFALPTIAVSIAAMALVTGFQSFGHTAPRIETASTVAAHASTMPVVQLERVVIVGKRSVTQRAAITPVSVKSTNQRTVELPI